MAKTGTPPTRLALVLYRGVQGAGMDNENEQSYAPKPHGSVFKATSTTETARLLETLRGYHGMVFDEPPNNDFIKVFIEPLRQKSLIDTDQYSRQYQKSLKLTVQGNGKPLKSQHRGVLPNMICFLAACANCVKAEHFACSPNVAWCYLTDGWYWYGLLIGRSSIKSSVQHSVEANEAKLKTDPKQEAKALIHVCWEAWQNNLDDYTDKTDFARDMKVQFPILKNIVSITRWCTSWERGKD